MKPFRKETGIAAVIDGRNIDTDQIIPARFLKADRQQGYGGFLFHDLRFDGDGAERPAFALNREPGRRASMLVTDDNFGCGSSREGAVYSLADFGIRALVGPGFGDIFYSNCLKNGVVPVRLDAPLVDGLRGMLRDDPHGVVEVDLEEMRVVFPDGTAHRFDLDPFWRECLMKGVDDLELTLGHARRIEAFIERYYAETPWAAVPVSPARPPAAR